MCSDACLVLVRERVGGNEEGGEASGVCVCVCMCVRVVRGAVCSHGGCGSSESGCHPARAWPQISTGSPDEDMPAATFPARRVKSSHLRSEENIVTGEHCQDEERRGVAGARRHQQLWVVGSGNTVSVFLSFFSSSQGNVRFLPIKGYYLDPNSLLLASIPSCPRDFRLGLGDEPGAPARSRAHEAVGEGDRVEDEREQREPGMTPSHRSIGRVLLPLPLFPGFPRTQDGKSRMRRNPKKPYMHFGSNGGFYRRG